MKMNDLRAPTKLYIAYITVLTLAGLGLTFLGLARAHLPTVGHATLAVVFGGLMALAVCFPIHYAFKAKLALDTSVAFAAALLFEPGIAMLVVGIGSLVGDILSRRPADEAIFNSAQLVLQVGMAALI